MLLLDANPVVFHKLFQNMKEDGERLLISEGVKREEIEFLYSLDLRYVKQYHEVEVFVTEGEVEGFDIASMGAKFHPAHNSLYGYSLEDQGTPIELINVRLVCVGRTEKPKFQQEEYAGENPADAYKRSRNVYLPIQKEFREVAVFDGT